MSCREALLSKKKTMLGQKQDETFWECVVSKVRQDSRQTSSKDGKTVFVLCEDSVSESDGIGAGGAAKTATHLRECDAR